MLGPNGVLYREVPLYTCTRILICNCTEKGPLSSHKGELVQEESSIFMAQGQEVPRVELERSGGRRVGVGVGGEG